MKGEAASPPCRFTIHLSWVAYALVFYFEKVCCPTPLIFACAGFSAMSLQTFLGSGRNLLSPVSLLLPEVISAPHKTTLSYWEPELYFSGCTLNMLRLRTLDLILARRFFLRLWQRYSGGAPVLCVLCVFFNCKPSWLVPLSLHSMMGGFPSLSGLPLASYLRCTAYQAHAWS